MIALDDYGTTMTTSGIYVVYSYAGPELEEDAAWIATYRAWLSRRVTEAWEADQRRSRRLVSRTPLLRRAESWPSSLRSWAASGYRLQVGDGAVVARRAHNPKVAGSSPAPDPKWRSSSSSS